MKDEAADEMANLIMKVKTIKCLNLSDCNMTEKENKLIVPAIEVYIILN